MSENLIAVFHRAAALVDATVSAIRADQYDGPTPCTQWTVRQLVNHVVTGNLIFASLANGAPPPDRTVDHLGDDPVAALRDSLDQLRGIFGGPAFLDQAVTTPFGPGTGATLVELRTNEFVVHSWDLARASGQSTELDHDLVEWSLASFQGSPRFAQMRGGEGGPFGPERPAPDDAPLADKLAAFVGRVV
jgi:uncharacterized protein (TIGR03086 family)